jgi:hypothetical protein
MFFLRRAAKRYGVAALDAIDVLHVYPVADVVAHDRTMDSGHDCVCGPSVVPVAGCWLITHHALDGREHHEPNHDRAACPVCDDD